MPNRSSIPDRSATGCCAGNQWLTLYPSRSIRLDLARRHTALARAVDVYKTENPTRDTTHGGVRLEALPPVCRKRPFTTQADRLRPRLKGERLESCTKKRLDEARATCDSLTAARVLLERQRVSRCGLRG